MDFVYHHARVAPFYKYDPYAPDSFAQAARAIDFPADRRAALVDALRQQNGDSPALEKLAQPGTVAVVTGQQVGLFSGPCFTIYKALSAVRLAAQLNESGIPAVVIYWLASEDHDFEEVRVAWNFNAAQDPVRHTLNATLATGGPVGEIAPPDFPVEALAETFKDLPFGGDVAHLVAQSYTPGRTMTAAFQALLEKILGAYGLLFLDPMRPAIRSLAAPLLKQAVLAAEEINERLTQRSEALAQAGYHVQVHFEEKSSLFFLLENGRRNTLRRAANIYAYTGGKLDAADLAARAESISPNALLRPVLQDYLLPTVAQIGGPAELAYLAQTQVIYGVLGRPSPVVLPRSGFTLLDPRGIKLAQRYGLDLAHFLEGRDALHARISAKLVPAELQSHLGQASRQALAIVAEMERQAAAFDSSLGAAAAKSRAKVAYQLSKIERKALRRALERDVQATAEAHYLTGLIFPEKHLQERLYTILPFLARHGFDLIGHIHDQLRLDCPDHIVLAV